MKSSKWFAYENVSKGVRYTHWAREGTMLAQRLEQRFGPPKLTQNFAPSYSLNKERVGT